MSRAIDVRLKFHAIGRDLGTKRLDLETAGVGEDGVGPVHKCVNAAKIGYGLGAGAEIEVIVVGQNDLSADAFEILGGESFDRSIGAYWHKNWGFDGPVRGGKKASAAVAW